MASGAGKYDKHALRILREELAQGVVVIVLGAKRGPGCSCKIVAPTPEEARARHLAVPSILRELADQMDTYLEASMADAASWSKISSTD